MFEHFLRNFIIFGRQILTTLKGRLLRPSFDTIIKEYKSIYNGNIVSYFSEKVDNSALITVLNLSKKHRKCSQFYFCVMRVLFERVVCRRVWRCQGIIIEVENTTQWQIIVCPFWFVHLLSVLLRLTDSDCPFRIFKLFLLYIKRTNNLRILVTRQRYHWKRKRKQIKLVRILIFVVFLWYV